MHKLFLSTTFQFAVSGGRQSRLGSRQYSSSSFGSLSSFRTLSRRTAEPECKFSSGYRSPSTYSIVGFYFQKEKWLKKKDTLNDNRCVFYSNVSNVKFESFLDRSVGSMLFKSINLYTFIIVLIKKIEISERFIQLPE